MKQIKKQSIKPYIIILIILAAILSIIMYIPNAVLKTIPTATSVTVKKLTHNDTVDVSGNIVKDAKTGEYYVQTFVSEKDISSVKTEQSAEITGDAFPNCVYTGEIKSIADIASKIQVGNAMKTMVQVDVLIADADDFLRPGYTANVKIKISDPVEMTIVPYDVINQDDNGEFVYIISDGTAVKRYISTGRELSQGVEVLSGITEDDTVITVDKAIDDGKTVILNQED